MKIQSRDLHHRQLPALDVEGHAARLQISISAAQLHKTTASRSRMSSPEMESLRLVKSLFRTIVSCLKQELHDGDIGLRFWNASSLPGSDPNLHVLLDHALKSIPGHMPRFNIFSGTGFLLKGEQADYFAHRINQSQSKPQIIKSITLYWNRTPCGNTHTFQTLRELD